jgi:hypothetical protein
LTFDAGGLIALDRNDRRVLLLLDGAATARAPITVPATALAQAIRAPGRQARLARLLAQPTTRLVPLDRVDATSVGGMLSRTRTADITDAHVVICARRARQPIVTSDPEDLSRLYPDADLIVV